MDIHEQHLDYLRKCHDAYQELVSLYGWRKIACAANGVLRSMEEIGAEVALFAEHAIEKAVPKKEDLG